MCALKAHGRVTKMGTRKIFLNSQIPRHSNIDWREVCGYMPRLIIPMRTQTETNFSPELLKYDPREFDITFYLGTTIRRSLVSSPTYINKHYSTAVQFAHFKRDISMFVNRNQDCANYMCTGRPHFLSLFLLSSDFMFW